MPPEKTAVITVNHMIYGPPDSNSQSLLLYNPNIA